MMIGRRTTGRICRCVLIGMTCAVVQLAVPRDAFALFEWLDHLSGPGPFRGVELQYRLFCAMNQESAQDVVKKATTAMASSISTDALPSIRLFDGRFRDVQADAVRRSITTTQTEIANLLAVIDAVTQRSGKNQQDGNENLLSLAAQTQRLERILAGVDAAAANDRNKNTLPLLSGLRDAALAAAVPRFRSLPGGIVWASCYDRPGPFGVPESHTLAADGSIPAEVVRAAARHRHPVFSLNLNYRFYTTGNWYGLIVPLGSTSRPEYANGKSIRLQALQAQGSVPITRGLDLVDFQASLGWYAFTSSDFDVINGLIVEPFRFDVHVPARVAEATRDPVLRGLASLSFRWGGVMFPGGIEASRFNATGSAAGKDVSGKELLLDWGLVLNIGRLFSKD
jgi:hypothetical protein